MEGACADVGTMGPAGSGPESEIGSTSVSLPPQIIISLWGPSGILWAQALPVPEWAQLSCWNLPERLQPWCGTVSSGRGGGGGSVMWRFLAPS